MKNLVFIGDLERYTNELEKRKKQLERLYKQADQYHLLELPTVHPQESTTYMGIAIVNLALAYRLGGKRQYLEDAKRFMDTVISYETWGNAHLVNVDLSASWILFGLSLGYDWLKEDLDLNEKKRIREKISHHARIIYDYRRKTYGQGWSTNFYQNHNWINMTGLATAGYVLAKEDIMANTYIEEAKENFSRVFSYLPEDGSNYEGVAYWRYGGMWLFVYAHLLKIQEKINYFENSGYLRNTFYYRLYQSSGDYSQQLNFGDSHDRHSSHPPCVYYKTAAEYQDGYAQRYGNLVLERFLQEEAKQSKVKPGILPEAAFEFLWYEPTVEERSLTELPLVRCFGDLGLLCVRENWEEDSKVFAIKCGYPGGKKQWETGWRLLREEGIHCFSLSHHHPDNLSYVFARGREYLTCEDGYNRNILPENHNVILVDGQYTDVSNVNDVYVESIKKRLAQNETEEEIERYYAGKMTAFKQEKNLIIYRAETAGIYPKELQMEEVSRLFVTDGLAFWVFVDICRSRLPHIYQIISNTDQQAEKEGENAFLYPMRTGDIHYKVYSNKMVNWETFNQEVVSVMTTQEPDKVCRTDIRTLCAKSAEPQTCQIFYQCFTFEDNHAKVNEIKDGVEIQLGKKRYRICGNDPISIHVRDEAGYDWQYQI